MCWIKNFYKISLILKQDFKDFKTILFAFSWNCYQGILRQNQLIGPNIWNENKRNNNCFNICDMFLPVTRIVHPNHSPVKPNWEKNIWKDNKIYKLQAKTPCPSESTLERFPVKIWPVKPLPGKKYLDFPPPQSISLNLVHHEGNVELLIFPRKFLNFTPINFDITKVMSLRQPLVSCRSLRSRSNQQWLF